MYEPFFGLSANPFRLVPDARFFYASSTHKRGLAYLRYGIEQGQGFVVVTGKPGTGKSTLVQALFTELSSQPLVVANLSSTNLSSSDVLQAVVHSFAINAKADNKASLLVAIEQFLQSRARQGKRVVLIVDEAQNLPADTLEELRMLSNFQLNDKPLLQIMLLGQQQLQQVLAQPNMEQLAQRVIASCHLQALNAEETRAYIGHRLQCVGWRGDPEIFGQVLSVIYAASRGVPRLINIFCDRLLLAAALDEKHKIDLEFGCTVLKELLGEGTGSFCNVDAMGEGLVALEPLPGEDFAVAAPPVSDVIEARRQSPAIEEPETDERLESVAEPEPVVSDQTSAVGAEPEPQVHEETEEQPQSTIRDPFEPDFAAESPQDEVEEAVSEVSAPTPSVLHAYVSDSEIYPDTQQQEKPPRSRLVSVMTAVVILLLVAFLWRNDIKEFMHYIKSDEVKRQEIQAPMSEEASPQKAVITTEPMEQSEAPQAIAEDLVSEIVEEIEEPPVELETEMAVVPPEFEMAPVPQKEVEPAAVQPPVVAKATAPVKPKTVVSTPPPAPVVEPEPVVKPEPRPVEQVVERKAPQPAPTPDIPKALAVVAPKPKVVKVEQPQQVSEKPVVAVIEEQAPAAETAPSEQQLDPPPAVSLDPARLDDFELNNLISNLIFYYESGDLNSFVDLFSENAVADDADGIGNIRKDYLALFDATDSRQMKLGDVRWKQESGNSAKGSAEFEVTVWRETGGKPFTQQGILNLEVIKERDMLLITNLSHVLE